MSSNLPHWLGIDTSFCALVVMWALVFIRSRQTQKKMIQAASSGDMETLKALVAQNLLIYGQRDVTYQKCITNAHKNKHSKTLAYLLAQNVFPQRLDERFGAYVHRLKDKNTFWYFMAYMFVRPEYRYKNQYVALRPSFNPLKNISHVERQRMFSETYRF